MGPKRSIISIPWKLGLTMPSSKLSDRADGLGVEDENGGQSTAAKNRLQKTQQD